VGLLGSILAVTNQRQVSMCPLRAAWQVRISSFYDWDNSDHHIIMIQIMIIILLLSELSEFMIIL
jgi:hypothetical protein